LDAWGSVEGPASFFSRSGFFKSNLSAQIVELLLPLQFSYGTQADPQRPFESTTAIKGFTLIHLAPE
jgi:hypothetical protein